MGNDRRSDRPQQDQWQRDLTSTLRRVGEQLALGIAHEAEEHVTRFAEKARNKQVQRETLKAERRRAKAEWRAARARERWRQKYEQIPVLQGYVYIVAAIATVLLAVTMQHMWWMVFVSIGLAVKGAKIIGFHHSQRDALTEGEESTSEQIPGGDERVTRIDQVCNKLKSALKDAPESVRSFLSKPEETVESLRKTTQDLLKREVQLRALVSPAEIERLNREHVALRARIEMERDDITRQRLSGALAALENQQQQHADVQRSADRREAERTRLMYTLEGLYAQVMRVKTADVATSEGVNAGLRVSLDQLREEMNALADAVEQVNRSSATTGFEAPETFGASTGSRTGERTR